MSVFVSCLRVCFKCVCRYIHIYRYTRKTIWTHTDTLYAHRNTWIRIWVCTCVFMYTYIYDKDTVCAYKFTHVCVYACIYERRLYMWVHTFLNVYMSVYTYLHICAPGLHVSVYIFTCMVAESTRVRVYVYIYAHRVCKWYMCLHICKLRLHVFVYISTYIHTETTCLRVYIYIYLHQVYRCVYAEFTCLCVCIVIHVRHIHMCVCIYLQICTRAYKCMHTCLCLYMCVWVYICMHICMWKDTWVHTDAMCVQSVCVCVHVACTHTGLHVCVYAYIYTRTLVYMCVYILTYMHAEFRGVYVYMYEYTWRVYTWGCIYICMFVGWVSMVCMYAWVGIHIYMYVRRVYMFRYTYLHVWSPSLLVFVYMFTYMHTVFAGGICVYIYANCVW